MDSTLAVQALLALTATGGALAVLFGWGHGAAATVTVCICSHAITSHPEWRGARRCRYARCRCRAWRPQLIPMEVPD